MGISCGYLPSLRPIGGRLMSLSSQGIVTLLFGAPRSGHLYRRARSVGKRVGHRGRGTRMACYDR